MGVSDGSASHFYLYKRVFPWGVLFEANNALFASYNDANVYLGP